MCSKTLQAFRYTFARYALCPTKICRVHLVRGSPLRPLLYISCICIISITCFICIFPASLIAHIPAEKEKVDYIQYNQKKQRNEFLLHLRFFKLFPKFVSMTYHLFFPFCPSSSFIDHTNGASVNSPARYSKSLVLL